MLWSTIKTGLSRCVLFFLVTALAGCNWLADISFSPDLDSATQDITQTQYPMLDTRTIVTTLVFPGNPLLQMKPQVIKFDIIQPSGTPYQTIWRAFSMNKDAPDIIEHPTIEGEVLQVENIAVNGGFARLYIGIPVAGTDITRYRIHGTYPVEVRLVGTRDVALMQSQFEIVL